MLDVIVVMKRDNLQEIVPSGKGDTMLIFAEDDEPTNKRFK